MGELTLTFPYGEGVERLIEKIDDARVSRADGEPIDTEALRRNEDELIRSVLSAYSLVKNVSMKKG